MPLRRSVPTPAPELETDLETIEDEEVPLALPGDTGDTNNSILWLIMLLAAGGALGEAVVWKKKKRG